jgi:phospholipid transport system transporter-binding protein
MGQLQQLAAGRYTLGGALVLDTVTALRREGLGLFMAESGKLCVDLSAVTSADSSGLALLVDWLAWATATGRELRYEHLPAPLMALARISDVSDLLA